MLLLVLPCGGLLLGCGARVDVGAGAATTLDAVAAPTSAEASVETAAPPTTLQSGSTVAPLTSAAVTSDNLAPPTTADAIDIVTSVPAQVVVAPLVSDASVMALAAVLGVEGEFEHRDGEFGGGQCIGRLESRGLCVNVPLWGIWQYWDLSAQGGQRASDDQASLVASDLFVQLGVDPGAVTSIEPNGPLPQVEFSSGALVMVAADGRIAMVIAGTSLLPTV